MANLGLFALAAATILLLTTGVGLVIPAAHAEGMRQSIGDLDIMLEPDWSNGDATRFKVSFLEPGTDIPHQHQDYDFIILQDDREVFSAAKLVNQPLIHNVEGTIVVPFQFENTGDYVVKVAIYGIGLPAIPMDEAVEFPVTVTPEFPAGALAVTAAVAAGMVAARKKL
jgi:hypothetical protein